jgi:hypothetical protein
MEALLSLSHTYDVWSPGMETIRSWEDELYNIPFKNLVVLAELRARRMVWTLIQNNSKHMLSVCCAGRLEDADV